MKAVRGIRTVLFLLLLALAGSWIAMYYMPEKTQFAWCGIETDDTLFLAPLSATSRFVVQQTDGKLSFFVVSKKHIAGIPLLPPVYQVFLHTDFDRKRDTVTEVVQPGIAAGNTGFKSDALYCYRWRSEHVIDGITIYEDLCMGVSKTKPTSHGKSFLYGKKIDNLYAFLYADPLN